MLQEMRLVRLAHRVPGTPEDMPSPARIFWMATEGSAATTPFKGEIGALEPGKAADLVVINWTEVCEPYLEPGTPIVDTVMVNGECIYRNRRFTRVDKDAAVAEVKAKLALPPSTLDVKRRNLAEARWPRALNFYAGYVRSREPRPFYVVNSRSEHRCRGRN